MRYKLFIHQRLNENFRNYFRSAVCHFIISGILLLFGSFLISIKFGYPTLATFSIFLLISLIGHALLFVLNIPETYHFKRSEFSFKKYEYLFIPFHFYIALFFYIAKITVPIFNKVYIPIIEFLNKDETKQIKKIEDTNPNNSILLNSLKQKESYNKVKGNNHG